MEKALPRKRLEETIPDVTLESGLLRYDQTGRAQFPDDEREINNMTWT